MKCDLVILNYKNYNDTIELLNSIFAGPFCKNINTIHVIDNDSRNDSLNLIIDCLPIEGEGIEVDSENGVSASFLYKTRYYDVVTYQSEYNLGYAGGNNIGLRSFLRGDSDFVVVCNNDLFFPDGQLQVFLEEATRLTDSNNIGLVGNI